MANLTESSIYTPGIFQLEKTTPPLGGAPVIDNGVPSAGHANAQALQLANRTNNLNVRLTSAEGDIDTLQSQVQEGGSATVLRSDLQNSTDETKGASLVGYDGSSVALALRDTKKVASYEALRNYTGPAQFVYVTNTGISGLFYKLSSPQTDNGGTIIGSYARVDTSRLTAEMFGAKADGVTDCTSAINSAISAIATGGGEIYLPGRDYKITGEIVNTGVGVGIRGANRWTTRLLQSNLSSSVINNSGMFFKLSDLCIDYTGTPTAGRGLYSTGSYSVCKDFTVRRGWDCIFLETGVAQRLLNFDVLNYERAGIRLKNLNDPFISTFIANANDVIKGRDGGICLEDKVEALMCSQGDVLLGEYSFTSKATVFGQNTRPAYNKFTDIFFDSSAKGCPFDAMVETDFINCWWSNGRISGAAMPGSSWGNVDSIRIIGGQSFNCGSHGSLIKATSKNVQFIGHSFESNSATAGDGVADGLSVETGASNWSVIGGKASNGLYTGKQRYGIDIAANCADFEVHAVKLKGNFTGPIRDLSTTTLKSFVSNSGYVTKNKGTANVPVGQTVASVTHGLARTPTVSEISVGFGGAPAASGVSSLYVAAITATTFQIVTNTAVTNNILPVVWRADIG